MYYVHSIVAERKTIDFFGLDRIMDAIVKEHGEDKTPIEDAERHLGKVTMTQYTYDKLDCKAQVKDGQKVGMLDVKGFDDNQMQDFVEFRRRVSKFTVMTIEEMQEAFFADEVIETAGSSQPSTCVAGPFDTLVDEEKVLAAFSDGLKGDLAVLKNKSYWVVVCVLFEWFGWLKLRKRDVFCRWVNAHFKFDKPLNHMIDMKSAINKIKVKEHDLKLWPPNQYRDLAYQIIDLFFGERQGLQNGFYVYANESQFLKPGKIWRRKDW